MRIIITTAGTRGDLQPYIALGLGLKKAGYQVQIVTAKNEESFVRSFGLDFYPLDVDIQKIMEGGEVQGMAKGNNPIKFILGHLKSAKHLKVLMIKTQGEIWKACANADLVIFHPGMPLGLFWAKLFNKKSILATPFPIVTTNKYPSILFYALPKLGKYYNLLTHFIFDRVFWSLAKSPIKEFWKKNIQTKINFKTSPVKQQIENGQLILNGYSRHLFVHPEEWQNNIYTTGSWIVEPEPDFVPPTDLIDFISNGEPPIYIGFGSMKVDEYLNETIKIIIEACNMTHQRAVISFGLAGYNKEQQLPGNFFAIDSVPHTWLFPKMKMVIHHGGAGTTATGLRAGKPTIIIPHNADQPAWGQRVFEIGVGSRPIRKTRLTAEKLAHAIRFVQAKNIVRNAELLGEKLQAENGVMAAVKIINDLMGKKY